MKLLYIDDNRLLAGLVKKLLSSKYTVDIVTTGVEGIERGRSAHYSLLLLDLGLPDMGGLEVCRELRRLHVNTPILVLTAQKDPYILVELLNCGADDYLTKPFNNEVLEARIGAVLRRSQEVIQENIIMVGDLKINITRRQVWRAGVKIALRRKEYDILEYLSLNQGRALTRSMIIDHVWESGKEGWNNTVDVHIKHLRDKVDRPFEAPLIKTAYGIGYMTDDSQ